MKLRILKFLTSVAALDCSRRPREIDADLLTCATTDITVLNHLSTLTQDTAVLIPLYLQHNDTTTLGLLYGISRNYSLALIAHSAAILISNNDTSHQTLAYYHYHGIGVTKSYPRAYYHYSQKLETSFNEFKVVLGGARPHPTVNLPSIYRKPKAAGIEDSDLILLYRLQAEDGDPAAQFMLGQSYYFGSHQLVKNFEEASHYFLLAVEQYPEVFIEDNPGQRQARLAASQSAGYLGLMRIRGEDGPTDYDKAREWFELGCDWDNSVSYTFLGLMYMEGRGVELDSERGMALLEDGVKLGNNEAKAWLAYYLIERGDYSRVTILLEQAKKTIMGSYLMARVLGAGYPGQPIDFKQAIVFAKTFIERMDNGGISGSDNDSVESLMVYLKAAERGYEKGQLLAASRMELENNFEEAKVLYIRAANQGNVEARIRAGDLYYYGFGVDGTTEKSLSLRMGSWITGLNTNPNYAEALSHYSVVADKGQSALAMFNLGWMYSEGLGVTQDFHLAKRWFDLAARTDEGAFLAIQIMSTILNWKWVFSDLVDFLYSIRWIELLLVTAVCCILGGIAVGRQRFLH